MNDDLFCNTGTHIYLRIGGVYLKRTVPGGWVRIEASAIPSDLPLWPLHDKQRAVYVPMLKREGLIE